MSWILIMGAAWPLLATPLALLVGRSIRLADKRDSSQALLDAPTFVPEQWTSSSARSH
jgi:hypothetical protein